MASSAAATSTTTINFHSEVVMVASQPESTTLQTIVGDHHRPTATDGILEDRYEGGISLDDLNQFKSRLRQDILAELCKYRRRRKTRISLVVKIRVSVVQRVLSQEAWGVPPPRPSPSLSPFAGQRRRRGALPNSFGELRPRSECVSLRCNHLFHMDCLREWMFKSLTCPLCRGLATTRGGYG